MVMRRFEVVSKYKDVDIDLIPKRSTRSSAGYDFVAAEQTLVPSIHRQVQSTLVPTGVKAKMPDDEYLMLVNRSSSPRKRNLALPNGVGIIDADYYNNDQNEGEIFLQLINYGPEDFVIQAGDRICQGIFMKYLLVEDEVKPTQSRQGGFGSSGS